MMYLGTRLHCGILCLEYKIPSLIVSVDNRAFEMSKSLRLPLITREEILKLDSVKNLFKRGPELILMDEILKWKKAIKSSI